MKLERWVLRDTTYLYILDIRCHQSPENDIRSITAFVGDTCMKLCMWKVLHTRKVGIYLGHQFASSYDST